VYLPPKLLASTVGESRMSLNYGVREVAEASRPAVYQR
jgi:hypothetical protein